LAPPRIVDTVLVPEPGPPLSDAAIARELQAIQERLAGLAASGDAEAITSELEGIREALRRLAADNDEVRQRLGGSLGLLLDE
jgi:hypothetical protein